MTAWQYLQKKGVGATAFAILLSGIVATNTWDALVQKSTAPAGSTAWIHLISVLDQVQVPESGGGSGGMYDLNKRLAEEDELLLMVIEKFINSIK